MADSHVEECGGSFLSIYLTSGWIWGLPPTFGFSAAYLYFWTTTALVCLGALRLSEAAPVVGPRPSLQFSLTCSNTIGRGSGSFGSVILDETILRVGLFPLLNPFDLILRNRAEPPTREVWTLKIKVGRVWGFGMIAPPRQQFEVMSQQIVKAKWHQFSLLTDSQDKI